VARGYTIDATYDVSDLAASTAAAEMKYPHDAAEVLRAIQEYHVTDVETVFLKPDPRLAVSEIRKRQNSVDVFVNLYDLSDATGQRIVDFMEKSGIAFTGAGSLFYDPTREELKRRCRFSKLHTPMYALLVDLERVPTLAEELGGYPLFVKPEHGFDSVGIDDLSIVRTEAELRLRVEAVIRDWGCALVERFVEGREFTVLVAGSKNKMEVFPPVEYVFPAERKEIQAARTAYPFITFQDKWGDNFKAHWVPLAQNDSVLKDEIMRIARELYTAFEGEGLARLDVRQDHTTGLLHVLDINPNCSLFYRDGCSADSIVTQAGWGKSRFAAFLLEHALLRKASFDRLNAVEVRYSPSKHFSVHATRALGEGDIIYSDEMNAIRLVTGAYVKAHWSKADMRSFHMYAWPVGPDTYAIWDLDWAKWKPINHSCDPNCWMQNLDVTARRAIKQGEELTLDYATFLPNHPPFECWCGAQGCRRQLQPNEYKQSWFKETYGVHVSPYIRHLMETGQVAKDSIL